MNPTHIVRGAAWPRRAFAVVLAALLVVGLFVAVRQAPAAQGGSGAVLVLLKT